MKKQFIYFKEMHLTYFPLHVIAQLAGQKKTLNISINKIKRIEPSGAEKQTYIHVQTLQPR